MKPSHMLRKDNEKIPISEVLEAIDATLVGYINHGYFIFRGEKYKYSYRMRCFRKVGTACIYCGRKGVYFLLEKDKSSETYHLALYALTKKRQQVLMTVDHIIPLTKGGKNSLENQVPCCYECNHRKADQRLLHFLKGLRCQKRSLEDETVSTS